MHINESQYFVHHVLRLCFWSLEVIFQVTKNEQCIFVSEYCNVVLIQHLVIDAHCKHSFNLNEPAIVYPSTLLNVNLLNVNLLNDNVISYPSRVTSYCIKHAIISIVLCTTVKNVYWQNRRLYIDCWNKIYYNIKMLQTSIESV